MFYQSALYNESVRHVLLESPRSTSPDQHDYGDRSTEYHGNKAYISIQRRIYLITNKGNLSGRVRCRGVISLVGIAVAPTVPRRSRSIVRGSSSSHCRSSSPDPTSITLQGFEGPPGPAGPPGVTGSAVSNGKWGLGADRKSWASLILS